MQLRPRDLAILETVGELGSADSQIIHRLHFPNDKTGRACQQRLKKIADEGLLKPLPMTAVDTHGGSSPMLYFLTEEGADLVERETGHRPRRITRKEPKQHTLRHRMDTVRARMAIDEAAIVAGIAAPEWIMEQDTRGGAKARKGHSPNEFQVLRNLYERDGHSVSFRPDASCHLQLPYKDKLASLIGYFEVDRSTEGHGQFEGKLPGVEAFLGDGGKGWQGHWPKVTDARVRVFVLCKSEQRLENLKVTIKASTATASIRLAVYPLDTGTVLTQYVWQDCDGKKYRIIESEPPTPPTGQ